MKRRSWIWIVITADLLVLVALAFVYPSAMVSPGALVPAHARLATRCFSCHAPFRGAASDRCIACHALPDIGIRTTSGVPVAKRNRLAIRVAFHQELTEQNCTSCHSEHQRLTQRRFSHALLRPAMRERCETCHAAPTNDFHRNLSGSCNRCHTTERWEQATFDHALLAKATLERCESCHKAPADNFHRQITNACVQCHSPQHWKPSTFDHDRFFLLDRDHNTACATCHVNNDFTRYSCYGCHEHTPANIRSEHEEERIRNFENCVSCHRSAEGEAGERGDGRERGQGREED